MQYRICENCGAALDPGERCDCMEQHKAAEKATEKAREKAKSEKEKRCA